MKTFIETAIHGLNRFIFRNVCLHTYPYMHATAISGERGHKFEEAYRRVDSKSWRKERELKMF